MVTPGEIEKGMKLTVLSNEPYHQETATILGGLVVSKRNDRSGMGDVLIVTVVQLPYIITESKQRYSEDLSVSTWDTRRTVFMELSKEYFEELNKQQL